jgi:hypothetical protein
MLFELLLNGMNRFLKLRDTEMEAGSLCYIGLLDCRAISQSHPGSYRRAPGVTTPGR